MYAIYYTIFPYRLSNIESLKNHKIILFPFIWFYVIIYRDRLKVVKTLSPSLYSENYETLLVQGRFVVCLISGTPYRVFCTGPRKPSEYS